MKRNPLSQGKEIPLASLNNQQISEPDDKTF